MYLKCPEGQTLELRGRTESSKIIVREKPRKDYSWVKSGNTKSVLHFQSENFPSLPPSQGASLPQQHPASFSFPGGVPFHSTAALLHCLVNTCFLIYFLKEMVMLNEEIMTSFLSSLVLWNLCNICFLFVCVFFFFVINQGMTYF